MSISRLVVLLPAALLAACGTTAVSNSHLAISATPQALDFSSQTAGTQSSKTFTLRNDGVGTLSITAVTVTGDTRGAFAVGATPKTLSGGSSAVVQVTYTAPAAEGPDGASLHISSNADNAPDLAISLSARSVLTCLTETDPAFCTRLGKNCGQVSAADNCGANRTVTGCGSCTSPQLCSGGVANVCTTPTFPVAVTLAGTGSGSVASSPAGINCGGTCNASFAAGTSVTLTPTAASGSVFAGFSGDCSGSTCALTVGAAKAVTATFTPQHTITVTVVGSGSISSSPVGITGCTSAGGAACTGTFTDGAAVVLTATASGGNIFSGWSAGPCSGTSTCSITPSGANAAATATFTAVAHSITVTVVGSGSVSSSPAGITACTSAGGAACTGTFTDGVAAGLTATPGANAVFSGWSNGPCAGTGACTITLSGGNAAATATFTPQHTLTVTVVGGGSVTSSPAGITACTSAGGAACTGTFTDGVAVVLTATAGGSAVFSGWSGGPCTGTATCQVTLSGSNASATATFAVPAPSKLNTARAQHSAVLLPNGKVLLVGGMGPTGPLKDAELYDPATGGFTVYGPTTHVLAFSTATLLNDGRVFIVGGWDTVSYASGFSSDTWSWTEASGFVAGPALPAARGTHSAVLLANGKVMIASGITNGSPAPCGPPYYPLDSQVFDPAAANGAGAWSTSGNLKASRSNATMVMLTGGLALLTGGSAINCPSNNPGQAEAELYDTAAGTWTATGSMGTSRSILDLVALPNGDALAAGGGNNTGVLAAAETYHLSAAATGAFTSAGAMAAARQNDGAVLLQSGQIAVLGGTSSATAYMTSVEVYDPMARTWSAGPASLATGRYFHTATVLKNGKVLVVGGYGAGSFPSTKALDSAEVLDETPGFTIGGTVSGLSGTGFVLGNTVNGGAVQQFAVSANGNFTMPNRAASGQGYVVSIVTQPSGPAQACTIGAGAGNAAANVTSVVVTCPPSTLLGSLNVPANSQQYSGRLYYTVGLPPTVADCYSAQGSGDKLMVVSTSGGTPKAIDDVEHNGNGNCGIFGIGFDSTTVYWANYPTGSLKKANLDGTGLGLVYTFSTGFVNGLVVGAGNLYYHSYYGNNTIARVSTAGTGNTTFASMGSQNGQNMAADSSTLFWTDSSVGTVNRVPFNAPSLPALPGTISNAEAVPAAPFLSSTGIYWLLSGASGALRYSPLASPAPVTLSTTPLAAPGSMVVDANFAYVLASGTAPNYADGRIYKIPVGGGPAVVIAQGLYQPNSITMDAGHLYWCNGSTTTGANRNSDGTIQMILK